MPCRSRVAHRSRGAIPVHCPVLVTLRVPDDVPALRRALAYVLLNARKHCPQRRRRVPPVVLDGASSGLWFDGWKGRGHRASAGGGGPADMAAVEGLTE